MDKVTLVINSCKKYFNIVCEKLLIDINKKNLGFNIIVFVGGHDTFKVIEISPLLRIVEIDNNSMDMTSYIGIAEHPELITTPFVFYVHDTIMIGDGFFPILQGFPYENIKEGCSISFLFPSSNMGLIHRTLFTKFKRHILFLKNTDYSEEGLQAIKSVCVLTEDFLFRLNFNNHMGFPNKPLPQWSSVEDIYGNGVKRMQEIYTDFDFCKYKGTFNRADVYNINP
jgi:hypothetical protein